MSGSTAGSWVFFLLAVAVVGLGAALSMGVLVILLEILQNDCFIGVHVFVVLFGSLGRKQSFDLLDLGRLKAVWELDGEEHEQVAVFVGVLVER